MTKLEVLKGVRALLVERTHWTQHAYSRDAKGHALDYGHSEGAVCWCLRGAIEYIDRNPKVRNQVEIALREILSGESEPRSLSLFNDGVKRTHAEVLAVLDKAIAVTAAAEGAA